MHLDHRKLRTPLGTHFVVPNEAIAQSVALEWDTQLKVIDRHSMHMVRTLHGNSQNVHIEFPNRNFFFLFLCGFINKYDRK